MADQPSQDPVLELRGVSKEFDGRRVVNDLSLRIPRGSFCSLLGPSGCGKTTTLRLIAGFEHPDTGEVLLEGREISRLPPHRRNVSTVFQSYALFPHLTTLENIEFGLRRQKRPNVLAKAREAIELVRMQGKEGLYPEQLSGGEKQRVALARSLVLEPALLLLDEPLSALDPNLRQQVRGDLRDLQRRTGVTFLFVTHHREEALSLSDQVAVLREGCLQQMDTPERIYRHPANRFVAEFAGAINWLPNAGVRPENIRLTAAQGGGLRASIVSQVFLGNCYHIECRLDTGLRVTVESERAASSDGDVFLAWDPKDELHV